MDNLFIGAPFMYSVINLALYSLTPRSIRRSYKSFFDLFGAVAGVSIPFTSLQGVFLLTHPSEVKGWPGKAPVQEAPAPSLIALQLSKFVNNVARTPCDVNKPRVCSKMVL